MNRITSITIAIAALLLGSNAIAGNSNANPCGNNGNNCTPSSPSYSDATANAGAVAGAAAISGSYSGGGDASIGDVTNIAAGGRGGDGGESVAIAGGGTGGVSNVRTDVNTSAQLTQSAAAHNNGNTQAVGGQSTNVKFEDVANAPPVFLGNISATMSCSGGFNAGGSSQDGSGALGFSWVSGDCRSVVAADKFRELGMVDTACKILKTTKGFKRAVKSDPSLADVSCTIAK